MLLFYLLVLRPGIILAGNDTPSTPRDFYFAAVETGSSTRGLHFVYSKEECQATIQHLLYPDTDIVKGLSALLEGQSKELRQSAIQCLDETAKLWKSNLQPTGGIAGRYQDGYDLTTYNALVIKQRCFNPYSPDTKDFSWYENTHKVNCEGKWLTKEESASIGKLLFEENERIKENRTKADSLRRYGKSAYLSLRDHFTPERRRLREIQAKLACYNPHPPGSGDFNYFRNSRNSKCNDTWVEKEEGESLRIQERKAQKDIDVHTAGLAKILDPVSNLLSDYPTLHELDSAAFRSTCARLDCFNYHPEGSWEHRNFLQGKTQCNGKMTSRQEADKAISELTKLVGDTPEKALAFLEETKQKALRKQDLRHFEANLGHGISNSIRQLLGRYRAFLNNGGHPDKTAEFCEENKKSQERDKRFFQLLAPSLNLGHLGPDSLNFKNVEGMGLSPSELSAITFYMGNGYKVVNPPLFKHENLSPAMEAFKASMDAGLKRFPSYNRPVLRQTTLPPEQVELHQVGNVICYNSYTSSSGNSNWNWGGSHHFVIFPGKKGRAVYEYHEGEKEVLFESGTCFKVLSVKKRSGNTEYVMAEVDEVGEPIGFSPYDGSNP